MKKKFKKFIYKINVIVLSAVLMLPVNAINTNRTVKKAKAAALEAGIVTLEMLLLYLISLAAENSKVNIPFPKVKDERTEMMKWFGANHERLTEILDDKNYSYIEYEQGGITYKTPVTFEYITEHWENINLDRVVVEDNSLEIDMMVMQQSTELLEEYFDVPKLTSVNPINSPTGNRISIKGVLQRNNVLLTDSVYDIMEEVGIFSYPYINVIKKINIGTQERVQLKYYLEENQIFIIASKYPFMYNVGVGSYGPARYDFYVGNIEPKSDNEMMIARIHWNFTSGRWNATIPVHSVKGINCYHLYTRCDLTDSDDNFRVDLYDLSKNVLYTTFDVYYANPTAYVVTDYLEDFEGQSRKSSLSYRTFLESKYGPLIGTSDEVIVINIDNWAEYDTEGITADIDNIANSDEALDRLKEIDNVASRYGDDVITPEIVLMEDYISEVDLAKYQAVVEVQGDIQSDFNNTYVDVIPTSVDIPENILNGLMFVAFVFGEMWAHLGSYSFVLVFSATIGAIAILIGLGKQVNDRGGTSSKPNKKSKKGG